MKKSKTQNYISFLSNASCDVTGSCHLVHWGKEVVVLDCGLIQGMGDIYSNYQANRNQLKKLRPKTYTACIISHQNIDHCAMLPYLYAKGYKGNVYIPEGLGDVIKILLEDSLHINQTDCAKIEKKGRKASLFYNEEDINTAMCHMIEVPFGKTIDITDNISFEYLPAGHLRHSASIYLILKDGSVQKKIYFSGDIGGSSQLYVEPRQSPKRFNVGICEATYSSPARPNNPKDRQTDLNKIVSIVNEYKRIIIPSFAMMRSEIILTELFRLWKQGKIPNDIPVYFDTPLGNKLGNIFDGGEEWEEVWNWSNLHKIVDHEDSVAVQMKDEKCIVVSSAGMCNAGRILGWLKTSLSKMDTHIVFIGYSPSTGTAAEIKSTQKEVEIDGELIQNKANYTELRSFSSHADYKNLLHFYSSLDFDKIAIVHSNQESKISFCQTLQNLLSEQGKSSRVICTNEGTKIFI